MEILLFIYLLKIYIHEVDNDTVNHKTGTYRRHMSDSDLILTALRRLLLVLVSTPL